jgi:hypothetical protein
LIRQIDARSEHVLNGPRDPLVCHVPPWIVVAPDEEISGMATSRRHDQIVKGFEVSVVSRQKYPLVADRLGKVYRILLSGESCIGRQQNIMPSNSEQLGKQRRCEIIIQVQPHKR